MKTRKEIKEEYKQMKFQIGVFQIRNLINGKIFISSLDLLASWNSQRFQLNAGLHQNSRLQKEWNDFGANNFVYEIVSELKQDAESTLNYNKLPRSRAVEILLKTIIFEAELRGIKPKEIKKTGRSGN